MSGLLPFIESKGAWVLLGPALWVAAGALACRFLPGLRARFRREPSAANALAVHAVEAACKAHPAPSRKRVRRKPSQGSAKTRPARKPKRALPKSRARAKRKA
jgi:hypothetical protein